MLIRTDTCKHEGSVLESKLRLWKILKTPSGAINLLHRPGYTKRLPLSCLQITVYYDTTPTVKVMGEGFIDGLA
jgi:hypothetical protein